MRPERLKKRRDFVAARSGDRGHASCFTMQARRRSDDEAGADARVGFTVTKKIGNAVVRNRIKRRLRAMADGTPPGLLRTGYDYVVLAKRGALDTPFDQLEREFARTLKRLHERANRAPDATGNPRSPDTARTKRASNEAG